MESLKEKDNIQTSLKPKKLDDAQEDFKLSMRRKTLKETNQFNKDEGQNVTQNNFLQRTQKL